MPQIVPVMSSLDTQCKEAEKSQLAFPTKKSKTKGSNQRKKRRLFLREGVCGLIEANRRRREARDKNRQRESKTYVRCAFECQGVRMGLVKGNTIYFHEEKKTVSDGSQERKYDNENAYKSCYQRNLHLNDDSSFEVDSRDSGDSTNA